jgi:O-antigen/teichoic acid export membrane protein
MLKKIKSFLPSTLSSHFREGTFLRNLSVVMTGTAIAQLISFAMMPIVSRLFTPEDFGIFGSYNSVLGVLSAGVTLQYAQAIVLPKYKEEGINLFFVSFLSVVVVTAMFAMAVLLFPAAAQNLINAPSGWFLILLVIATLVAGLNQAIQAWCIRVKAFKATSVSQVIRSLSAVGIWIAAGFGHMGAMGLAAGAICADILASLNLWRVVKRDLKETHASVVWGRITQLAHEFRDFPFFSAPQNVMNALSQGLPVLLLGYYYGVGVAGFYAFGIRILQTPMNFILTPLRQVLFQKASETHNQGGNLYPLFLKTTGGLMAIALVPCAILFIWAPQLFSWIFGAEWHEAGTYARWLLLWLFAGFCNVPAVIFARIMRQQRNLFLYEGIILLSRTTILVIGGIYWSSLTSIISFSILGFILNIALIGWIVIILLPNSTNIVIKA